MVANALTALGDIITFALATELYQIAFGFIAVCFAVVLIFSMSSWGRRKY